MAVGVLLSAAPPAGARDLIIRSNQQLGIVLRTVKPGRTLKLDPGKYRGGLYAKNLAGTRDAPIILEAADPKNPPQFVGTGEEALHLADCSYLVLRNIKVRGFRGNGINIDDGGSYATPSHHITLENVTIEDIGPKGNHDGLKMSGVDHFVLRNCRFQGWGGSAIDMVGCHHGVIEDSQFLGKAGFSQDNAVQIKGGSRDVTVRACYFKDAGERAINIGGSTDIEFFRPAAGDYEAKDVVVAGNRFVGSWAAVAWVTADGGHVHHNTIYMPGRWVMRILQETRDSRFKPSHGGLFERNLIVYDKRTVSFANVGPGTAPKTFTFRQNAWFRADGPTRVQLPAPQTDAVLGVDPKLQAPGLPTMKAASADPRLKDVGADAYVKPATPAP